MNGNDIALSYREPFNFVLGLVYHQMNIKRERRDFAEISAIIRAESEIRHKRAVHYIYMQTGDAVFFENFAISACVIGLDAHHGGIKSVHCFLLILFFSFIAATARKYIPTSVSMRNMASAIEPAISNVCESAALASLSRSMSRCAVL